jgi:hypothetical protein
MRQWIADALQITGAAAFAGMGFTVNLTAGLVTLAVALVAAGVVVERS